MEVGCVGGGEQSQFDLSEAGAGISYARPFTFDVEARPDARTRSSRERAVRRDKSANRKLRKS